MWVSLSVYVVCLIVLNGSTFKPCKSQSLSTFWSRIWSESILPYNSTLQNLPYQEVLITIEVTLSLDSSTQQQDHVKEGLGPEGPAEEGHRGWNKKWKQNQTHHKRDNSCAKGVRKLFYRRNYQYHQSAICCWWPRQHIIHQALREDF